MEENIKNKKKQKRNLVFIIIILLFLLICLLYHSGYIRPTVDIAQKEETVHTEEDKEKSENTNNRETNTSENTDDIKYNWGPYDISHNTNINISNTSSNHYINTTVTNTNKPNINENITKEDVEKLKFMQGKDEFKTLNNLDMFKNFEYEESKLIYPGLSGKYYFQVENNSEKDMEYILSVIENNPRNVNMKYALKRNGIYIAGNDNQYANISELQKTNLWIASGKGDNYILYWKWVDTDKDALSSNPIERGEYKLTIKGEV